MAKRERPQDARRSLRKLWSSVSVYSCADGTLKIEPKWAKRFGMPGFLTRMHSAYLVECVLTLPVKHIDWKQRADELLPQESSGK